ncbi:MAG: hypothetical protein OK436_07595, partial [Thaumarchaeota archaeon]|nr:hypothetical protein [Nitrososphaerota archaeon]
MASGSESERPAEPDTGPMKDSLHGLLTEHQGKGAGKYDALVLYSGGKDSTLLLHKLVTEYPGLRLLALTVDNGFMSQAAVENTSSLRGKLDLDHSVFRPHGSLFGKTFRHALRSGRD